MVTSVLKLGRSTPTIGPPVDSADLDSPRSTSALASIAKRSLSASGLSRRSASQLEIATASQDRSRSLAPINRAASVASLPVPNASSKTLMSSLLSGHGRSASPGPGHTPPLSNPSSPNVPSQAEASYISKVASRLHEMVNKIFPAAGSADALHAVAYKGRCSPRPDRAKELGEFILHEIQQASEKDHFLLRTLLRSAILRTLTVFSTRLESLMPATLGPDATTWTPKTLRDTLPPLDKRFEFDIVKTAYEVKAALQQASNSSAVPAFAKDAFAPWILNFEASMNKIMNPLLSEIKKEVGVLIARARSSVERVPSGSSLPTNAVKHTVHLNGVVDGPAYLQELAAQLAATKRLLVQGLACGKEDSDRWIVSIATALTWNGMLAYAARPCPADDRDVPPPSSSRTRATKKTSILASRAGGKRSPSPPAGPHRDATSRLIDEVSTFRTLIIHFTHEVLPTPVVPPSADTLHAMATASTVRELCDAFDLLPELDDEEEEGMALTQQAMHEAMLALSSFELTLRALRWPDELKVAFLYDDEDSSSSSDEEEASKRLTPSTVFNLIGPSSPASRLAAERARSPTHRPSRLVPIKLPCPALDRALETLPPLITFHLLVSRLPMQRNSAFRLPHEVWQLAGGWSDYVSQLTGFAAGESFAPEVGWQMVAELDRLRAMEETPEGVWEDLLRVAVQSEVGIQQSA